MLGNVSVLPQDGTHEFTYIPAAGYGFQPASGIVADFRFDVDVDGQVVVDPRCAGFAQATGRTLTISGYRITIDGSCPVPRSPAGVDAGQRECPVAGPHA